MKLNGVTIYSMTQHQADHLLVLMTTSMAGFDEELRELIKKPIGPTEMSSAGFVHPTADGDAMTIDDGRRTLLFIETEQRNLPADYLRRMTNKRVAEIEEKTGEKVGGKERKRVREDVIAELLPHAAIKTKRVPCWIDFDSNTFWVGTISRPEADAACSLVRDALGSFQVAPLNAELGVVANFTDWLGGVYPGDGMLVTDSCKLEDSDSGVVTMKSVDVMDDSEQLIESGMFCTRIGLKLSDHDMRFVLDSNLTIRNIELPEVSDEAMGSDEPETAEQRLKADFAITSGMLAIVFERLSKILKISQYGEES